MKNQPHSQEPKTLVGELFDRAAQCYDQARRQLVPCFDDLYGVALQLLPADRNQPLRILDLGAGTGLFAAFIAASHPNARITLVDVAADMLHKAAQRLEPYRDRVAIQVMDMAQLDTSLSYDVVVSALAIHHLEDAQKCELFKRIYTVLVPGGRFIHVEQVLGTTPEIEQVYGQVWLQAARARGVSDADLSAAMERMQQDRAALLHAQLRWLEDEGFANVNCWYKWYRFVVYSGDKLSGSSQKAGRAILQFPFNNRRRTKWE